MDFFAERAGEFAYVTTNSISQGDQVPRLFGPLEDAGWRIKFAHRPFAWTSEAPGKAAVHCVIVGFTRGVVNQPRLWDYPTLRSQPQRVVTQGKINGYLVEGPHVMITPHHGTMNALAPEVAYGSTPRDGGHLIINPGDYEEFMSDLVAAKYVRPFMGAKELLHGKKRWCLWLVDLDPKDVAKSSLLRDRIDAVRRWREASPSKDANQAAATPHLFWWRSQPSSSYLCIPGHVGDTRNYFMSARMPADVISSNAVFTVPDPDGIVFALASSSMFMTWQENVGGRLGSSPRFSSTLTWNNFPLPQITEATRKEIIKAGERVQAARQAHPERTLADAYNPLAMDPLLVKAHNQLDRVVDKAFGASQKLTMERQRLELLFQSYADLTNPTKGQQIAE